MPQAAPRVLVRGCGDVGSAVAHALHVAGLRVALSDLPQSAHARRGMAYTDALFDGEAVLEGVRARRVPDVAALTACWNSRECIPLATWSEAELLGAPGFDVVVDATMRRQALREDLRPWAALSIGIGPGFVPGTNCHVAIETQWGRDMGRLLLREPTAALAGGPQPLEGVARERFVAAPATGVWRTSARIGEAVEAQAVVGHLEGMAVRAPLRGTLRGVTHDSVRVRAGQKIVEVDPRSPPQVFGLGERPKAVARGVLEALH